LLNTKLPILISAVAVTGIAVAAYAAVTSSVTYNGNVISHDVRVIDGRPFIPLADAARALGGSVVKTAQNYEIAPGAAKAGGANQINGLNGKIGQMLFTGKWRFEVLSVNVTQQYQTVLASSPNTDNPTGSNDELVVVNCLVKNAQTETSQLMLRTENPMDTTVTDNQGVSYGRPIDFDFAGGSGYGPTMAPGAAVKFAVVFDVPKGTTVNDLIMSLATLEDRDHPADARVSLAQ
jgi:hypothetical protein